VGQFEALFRSARHFAWHLELRDGYMRDADFHDWQAGHHFDPVQRWRSWFDLVKETTSRGVEVRRARVVSEPISDYVRFEYDVTSAHNVAAGEEVRWLPRRQAARLLLPGADFWLFDGETVLFNHFTGDGDPSPEGMEETVTDPAVAKTCAAAFDEVWQRATPHEDYRPA
jgi:hypothetical protein